MFDETSKWSKSRPIRLETFIQVEIRVEIQGFGEKTSRLRKIPFLATTCHNHKPIGRSPRGSFFKNQAISNDRMNRRPKWLNLNFCSSKTHENYKTLSPSTGMGPRWQDLGHEDIKKNHQHFEASWKNPKSKKCSTELNIDRSETNEDSTSM